MRRHQVGWFKRLLRKRKPYKLSDQGLSAIIDNLDDTAGFLIKESTLRYWIERIVNEDRERR